MASVPRRALVVLRVAALGWLLLLAPLELATTLATLASRPVMPAVPGLALVASRVAAVATGLVLGRHLFQRHPASRSLAMAWAAADLGTLAVVLATRALPTNRLPGDAPWVWLTYAAAAAVVLAVATWDHSRTSEPRRPGLS